MIVTTMDNSVTNRLCPLVPNQMTQRILFRVSRVCYKEDLLYIVGGVRMLQFRGPSERGWQHASGKTAVE